MHPHLLILILPVPPKFVHLSLLIPLPVLNEMVVSYEILLALLYLPPIYSLHLLPLFQLILAVPKKLI
jgi:hypothetical protein